MKKITIGFSLIALMMISFIAGNLFNVSGPQRFEENPKFVIFFVFTAVATVSAMGLWIWMVIDYFYNRKNMNHKSAWGWGLLLGNWVAGIAYFIAVYSQREKKVYTKSK
jgi:type VI protein secretion system component VasK